MDASLPRAHPCFIGYGWLEDLVAAHSDPKEPFYVEFTVGRLKLKYRSRLGLRARVLTVYAPKCGRSKWVVTREIVTGTSSVSPPIPWKRT